MPSSLVARIRTRRTYPRTPGGGRSQAGGSVNAFPLAVPCPVRQPRRLILYALGAFGAAGVAVLRSSGTAHAHRGRLGLLTRCALVPVPVAPRAQGSGNRRAQDGPHAPVATDRRSHRGGGRRPGSRRRTDPAGRRARVLPLRALRPVDAPTAPSPTVRLRSAPAVSTASRLAPSRARVPGRALVRPVTPASVAARSAPSRPSGGGVPPFDSRGGPPGVTADTQRRVARDRRQCRVAGARLRREVEPPPTRRDHARDRCHRRGGAPAAPAFVYPR